jgi:uncharacterized glyoxalase superfamily protein PhnB
VIRLAVVAVIACSRPASPPTLQRVTAVLRVADVAAAIAGYERAFRSRTRLVLYDARGPHHAELAIGSTLLWLDRSDDHPLARAGTTGLLRVRLDDPPPPDRLRELGFVPLAGERWRDPFGQVWRFATDGPELTPVLVGDDHTLDDALATPLEHVPEDGWLRTPRTLGGAPFRVHVYVDDCERAFQTAIAAGATARAAPALQLWGDRWGMVEDRAGHTWGIGQRIVTLDQPTMQALDHAR